MIKVTDYFGLGDDAAVIETAAKLLNLEDVEITVIQNDRMLNNVGGDNYVVNGLLHKTKIPGNNYNLFIRKDTNEPIRVIICHEMLHLKQYMDGNLSVDLENQKFKWKGKDYPYSYPYEQRPWEQEVFRQQSSFINKVKKALPKKECFLTKIFNKSKKNK